MAKRKVKAKEENQLLKGFKIKESYVSLILGIVVVVTSLVLVVSFLKNRNQENVNKNPKTETSSDKTQATETVSENKNTYTVVNGDTLWSIAEKTYKSGYNWVDIAKANNLQDPNLIESGQKLTLPKIQVSGETTIARNNEANTTPTNKITDATYTVKKGDYLWEIAVRAYGDGYKWVDIAKANNLANPDIIHSDNVFKIPR
ncbi:MAG: LysM peptidoglycan-binding domain-containing protein [Patescibacteria group bacterium]|nr:LysM peptidoglycan-binding domain-containing protein [Patescibacteria group bacterium]